MNESHPWSDVVMVGFVLIETSKATCALTLFLVTPEIHFNTPDQIAKSSEIASLKVERIKEEKGEMSLN